MKFNKFYNNTFNIKLFKKQRWTLLQTLQLNKSLHAFN